MPRLRNLLLIVVFCTVLIGSIGFVEAHANEDESDKSLTIHYVYSDECPYCAQQDELNEDLKNSYPNLEIEKYNVNQPGIQDTVEDLANEHDSEVNRLYVPLTFINGSMYQGFNPAIEEDIRSQVVDELGDPKDEDEFDTDEDMTYIPYLGETNLMSFSLPALAVILGFVDGLNVCSIGALLLILGIVTKFDSRRKILIYGGLFILTTVIVYGVTVFLWYGLIENLMGYFGILNTIIGITGIIGGIYFFREFLKFYKHGPACEATGNKYVQKFSKEVSDRLHSNEATFASVAVAVILFAAGITIVELPCSVALPVVFTGVLAESSLSIPIYTMYILIYLLMYMMIELVIFGVAIMTKDIWYGPNKAVTWTTLLASIILFILGLYYLPNVPFGS